MVRWQDRGEVPDSDDDDLSLGIESQVSRLAVPLIDTSAGTSWSSNGDGEGEESLVGQPAIPASDVLLTIEETTALPENAAPPAPALPVSQHLALLDVEIEVRHDERFLPQSKSRPTWYTGLFSAPLEDDASPLPTSQHDAVTEPTYTVEPGSTASSPLSSLSSSPTAIVSDPGAFPISSSRSSLDPHISGIVTDRHHDADHVISEFGRRSLRARQAKQMHPYMYEKELYQRQCRERGMKPVRLEEVTSNAEDTQEASQRLDESQNQLQARFSSSPGVYSSSPMVVDHNVAGTVVPGSSQSHSGSQSHSSSDDDLPDIGSLLAQGTAASDQHRRKRRKLLTQRVQAPSYRKSTSLADNDTFAVLVSPPLRSSSSRPSSKGAVPPTLFRRPRGLSPLHLPTPEISSEIRPPPRTSNTPGSLQRSPQRGARRSKHSPVQVQTISDGSSGKSEPEAQEPEIDDRRLVKERRRIKGVLPASWLKIDLKAQTVHSNVTAPANRDLSPSPSRGPPATQKGVARTVHRPHRRSPSLALDMSDGDGTDSSPARRTATSAGTQSEHDSYHATSQSFIGNDDDVMEVDTIDMMFAGGSRGPRKSGLFRKKQPGITQAFQRVQSRTVDIDLSENHRAQRSLHAPLSPKRRRRNHHTHSSASNAKQAKSAALGILDQPRSSPVVHEMLPTFIRLARRTAKRSLNAARASPTRKTVRLATRDDTAEANEPLQRWRTGKLMPYAISTPAHTSTNRSPLAPLLNHQQQTRLPDGLPIPHNGTQAQSRTRSAQGTLRQPRLDKYAVPRAAEQEGDNPDQRSDDLQTPHVRKAKPTRPAVRYQTAQLESLEADDARLDRLTAFRRQIERMTAIAAQGPRASEAPGIANYHRRDQASSMYATDAGLTPMTDKLAAVTPTATEWSAARLAHRFRKRHAARLDIESATYRQPAELLAGFGEYRPEDLDLDLALIPEQDPTLKDLAPHGTRYTVDFDIRPLPLNTHFHHSTFIGSGDFPAALTSGNRDLDVAAGTLRIYIDTEVYEWSAWTEEVSSAIAKIPAAIASAISTLRNLSGHECTSQLEAATANVDHMLRSVVRYLTRCLWFLDPVDRTPCVARLHQLLCDLLELETDDTLSLPQLGGLLHRTHQYSLVIARQSTDIASSAFVPPEMHAEGTELLASVARAVATQFNLSRLDDLRGECERCLHSDDHEIREDASVLSAVMILHHTLHGTPLSFWAVVNARLAINIGSMVSVRELDSLWYSVFTLLPAIALPATGRVVDTGSSNMPSMDWTLPRAVISRCFELYAATSRQHGSTINEYIRAIMTRCYTLVATWQCWTCEPVLGTILDFFAKRGLGLLRNEHGHGSPDFLEHLAGGKPDLLVIPQDRSFHIFLKLLAVTNRGLRQHGVYTDKKIASMTWRFIPNHARVYRRDAEVKQSDIEALRNHCDLLSTLYFAAPPSGRPSIRLLQDLVDLNTSHIEACRIIIKSWANLAAFQMSLDEDQVVLGPLAAWYKDMVHATCSQYRLARTEAQQQYAEATAQGTLGLTHDLLERTVATNQRQVAAMLVDLLACMRRAVSSAKDVSGALFFIKTAEPWKAFDSFDPSERRLLPVFNEALELIEILVAIRPDAAKDESQPVSDDSQDYGDSSIFQDLDGDSMRAMDNAKKDIVTCLAEHVAPLVSNAYGSEFAPDDALLMKLIEVWAALGSRLVQQGSHTWSNLVDDYSPGAWYQLRDTAQHRKYTPLFLARLVATGREAFSSLKCTVLTAWLKSLVERESNLKYQHELTAALLRYRDEDDLLSNLPFVSSADGSDTIVTLQKLRERRLATIASVLSSMRDGYNSAMYAHPQALSELRRTYANLLRQLMQAMKSNYQDLQTPGSNAVAGEAQGAYVIFVQQLVSALQQYTTDVCPVDRFFTDSSVFPLPVNDPEYVVGRLRAYVPKLSDAKTRKQLAVFVHTVSERAAVDGQQAYLAEQLATAMSGPEHVEAHTGPSLRYVMITSILPAYIENALASACSWILAVPALDACTSVISELLHDIDLDSGEARERAVEESGAVLLSAQHMLGSLRLSLDAFRDKAETKVVLSRVLDLCRAGTSLAQHIRRTTSTDDKLLRQLYQLRKAIHIIVERPHDPMEDIGIADELGTVAELRVATGYPDTGDFTTRQLQDSLAKDWYEVTGRYYVRRGNGSKDVVTSLGTAEQVEAGLRDSMRRFEHSWQAITCTRRLGRRRIEEEEDHGLGDLVV